MVLAPCMLWFGGRRFGQSHSHGANKSCHRMGRQWFLFAYIMDMVMILHFLCCKGCHHCSYHNNIHCCHSTTAECKASVPSVVPYDNFHALRTTLVEAFVLDVNSFDNKGSPQNRAANWLANEDSAKVDFRTGNTDRISQ